MEKCKIKNLKITFNDEHATIFGTDDQSAVTPRVAACDVMTKVRIEALRFPRGPFEQASGCQAGGRVTFDDCVEFERLADAYKLHLTGLFFAARATRWLRQHVAERSSVQHCLQSVNA